MANEVAVTADMPAGEMKETREVIAFLAGLGEAMKKAMDDKELNMKDIGLLPHLGALGKDAVMGTQGIVSEWKSANGEAMEMTAKEFAMMALVLYEGLTEFFGGK